MNIKHKRFKWECDVCGEVIIKTNPYYLRLIRMAHKNGYHKTGVKYVKKNKR